MAMMGKSFTLLSTRLLLVARCYPFSSLAFSHVTYRPRQQLHKSTCLHLSTLEQFAIDANDETLASSFNPLGPPDSLSNLAVGDSIHTHGKNITRLSSSPDVFLVKYLISAEDRNTLMQTAQSLPMKVAGTRQSGENTVRKNSYLTWIDPFAISAANEEGNDWRDASLVARETILKSRSCFTHDAMNDLINKANFDYCFAEDLQVAKYDRDGRFDYHHDGYSRYLTVLSYLNGVGGTYFPFGGMKNELEGYDFTNEDEVISYTRQFEKCGILIVGEEGPDSYLQSASVKPMQVVQIEAGDAIAFYSYLPCGERDLRVLHCSLSVPREKWISTVWLRSEALTGPFASFKKAKLFEEFYDAK